VLAGLFSYVWGKLSYCVFVQVLLGFIFVRVGEIQNAEDLFAIVGVYFRTCGGNI
jgi:hypothetical protein